MRLVKGELAIPGFSGASCDIEGVLNVPEAGQAILEIISPRALRLWIDGALALDEPLFWRRYEREFRAVVSIPLSAGTHKVKVEAGGRSGWHESIDEHCPSRNREFIRSGLLRRHPDKLQATCEIQVGVSAPAFSLRFTPSQFIEDGVTWQHLVARRIAGFNSHKPTNEYDAPASEALWGLSLRGAVAPFEARDISGSEELARGARRFILPVGNAVDPVPELRKDGSEPRIEPECQVAKFMELSASEAAPVPYPGEWVKSWEARTSDSGIAALRMPVFEERGRLAPSRERKKVDWPEPEALLAGIPKPLLPGSKGHWLKLHEYAWRMLLKLRRKTNPYCGLPNEYVGTAMEGFHNDIFVWDSSFTAMGYAWGHKAFPTHATLDCLLARQFDGGYIHREINVHDGMPDGYEPDFSPNPPILVVAEWKKALLTGDTLRLAKVYPALCASHRWLVANRRLSDGTYWTTGLANGLDNSPSLGDGYPDLTAQMAHSAEILSLIAKTLGKDSEAKDWERERQAIGAAMNERLWSERMKFFSTSLPEGGHNPNKVVTGFWPLWTGLVPKDRVDELSAHLLDPKSFWRHHPVPSLAADSPQFIPGGNYWLGSTWAPTNAATIWGFDRAGRHDLAVKVVERHLDVMFEVFEKTGRIWENYCSERSERGSWSGHDYSWTSLGPIGLLYEIVIGLRPDALSNRIEWVLPTETGYGIERMAFGSATVGLKLEEGRKIRVSTDKPFELAVVDGARRASAQIPPGVWTLRPEDFK